MLSHPTHIRFAALLSFVFLIVSCCLVLRHELWMDESYHYLLARDLVMKEPLKMPDMIRSDTCRIDEIAIYTGAVITSEDYYLYLISIP